MRFHYGNAPENPADPALGEGWRSIPTINPARVQNYGLIAGLASALLVSLLLRGEFRPSNLWIALSLIVLTIPLHELVHALFTPAWGMSSHTVIGFQRGKGLFMPYMYYDGDQALWRMLLTGLAPVLILSALPVLLLIATPMRGAFRADIGFLAFYNAALSGGDLVNFYWLLAHLPIRATVRMNGWGMLWKE